MKEVVWFTLFDYKKLYGTGETVQWKLCLHECGRPRTDPWHPEMYLGGACHLCPSSPFSSALGRHRQGLGQAGQTVASLASYRINKTLLSQLIRQIVIKKTPKKNQASTSGLYKYTLYSTEIILVFCIVGTRTDEDRWYKV